MCKLNCVKVFIGVQSVLAILGGLTIIGFTFFMILTTTWTQKNVSSVVAAASSPSGLSDFAISVAGISFGIGVFSVLFGVFGVCI
jgi:hypothetical protein